MPKNHFPRNGQLKLKKRAFKNNNKPQGRETQIKITIRTKNPLHKINLIDPVLSVARVGILLDFANFRNMNLSRKLM